MIFVLPEIIKLLKQDLFEVRTAIADRLLTESLIVNMSNHYEIPRP